MNKYRVVVCGDIDSLRSEMSNMAKMYGRISLVQDLILDRNDCTIRYKIGFDIWNTLFVLPFQEEMTLGMGIHDFYTVGPDSEAIYDMTRKLSYRYFITQHKEASCKIKSTSDPINESKSKQTNKSLISSLKKLASRILSWMHS